MAQSVVSICNMALGHIGRSTLPILALTDPSIEARWRRQVAGDHP